MNNLHDIINNNNRLLQVLFLLKQQVIDIHFQLINREQKQFISNVKNVFQVLLIKINHSIENGRYIKGFFSPETENITLCKDTIESNEEVMITYEYTKLAYYDSCT